MRAMSEFRGWLDEYEASFEHSFASLAERIRKGYAEIDFLAHRNGSAHSSDELLFTQVDLDGVERRIYLEQRENGLVKTEVHDAEGKALFYWICNIAQEEDENDQRGGKHSALPMPPDDALPPAAEHPWSYTDRMLVVANTLEQTYDQILRTVATVVAYDA
jgi:hypothetical protein